MKNFKEQWRSSDDTYGVEKALLDSDKRIIENLELILPVNHEKIKKEIYECL